MTNAKGHLDTFLDGLGVRLLPVWRRRKGAQSHARGKLREIAKHHGWDHLGLVVRFIIESEGNKTALWSETAGALSDVLAQRPDWQDRPSDVFAAMDTIDLNKMRERAVRRRPWPIRHTMRAFLYDALEQRLDTAIDKDLFGEGA
ncbi:hypothetical protein ACLNGM_14985 [Aureimonas phyllosphaerae]|uniref:Uncharacterized protein n=1 Tax=Aureimonas flava TaxID=2320271 RepID=A0A3A1WJY9_9HYPH|nr:hypothetical protein [Aureimonas flava]RIY00199.1 hypothetical protein D3218_13000 [Aureimonas flava]